LSFIPTATPTKNAYILTGYHANNNSMSFLIDTAWAVKGAYRTAPASRGTVPALSLLKPLIGWVAGENKSALAEIAIRQANMTATSVLLESIGGQTQFLSLLADKTGVFLPASLTWDTIVVSAQQVSAMYHQLDEASRAGDAYASTIVNYMSRTTPEHRLGIDQRIQQGTSSVHDVPLMTGWNLDNAVMYTHAVALVRGVTCVVLTAATVGTAVQAEWNTAKKEDSLRVLTLHNMLAGDVLRNGIVELLADGLAAEFLY